MALQEVVQPIKKETKIFPDVEIKTFSQANSWEIVQASQLYFKSWKQYGLCENPDDALRKVANFDPNHSYLLVDKLNPEKGVVAAINTLPVFEPTGVSGIVEHWDTYKKVENSSMLHQKTDLPNFVICFSVVTNLESIPKVKRGKDYISPSRYLLEGISTPANSRKIAYSRVQGPVNDNEELFDFYWNNFDKKDTKSLGPVGMHEHYGGLVTAVLNFSRPEDRSGGKGNILVLYPTNEMEKDRFEMIKTLRKKIKQEDLSPKPYQKIGTNIIYTDF